MNKKGEIIAVDDDNDDLGLIIDAFRDLRVDNKVLTFPSAEKAMEYLRRPEADPFFMISDYRMQPINGLEMRQMIYADQQLIKKAVPFVLFSSTIDSDSFNTALMAGVQGFFVKPTTYTELKDLLKIVYNFMSHAVGEPISAGEKP